MKQEMNSFIDILKRSPKLYFIRKDFKMYITDQDIEINQIKQNSDNQQIQLDNIFELEGDLIERLNFYLFQKNVNHEDVFKIFQDIYLKVNRSLNKINPNLVQMKLAISEISPTFIENQKELHQKMIGSDDLLLILADQIVTQFVWQKQDDYKIELVSPLYINRMHYIAQSDLSLQLYYEKREQVCGNCGLQTDSSILIDLANENSMLSNLNMKMVISKLYQSLYYDYFCECCVSCIMLCEDNSHFVKPLVYKYSHIKFENIILYGELIVGFQELSGFYIEIQIDEYLKSLTSLDKIFKYVKFVYEDSSYLRQLSLQISERNSTQDLIQQLQKIDSESISETLIFVKHDLSFAECEQIGDHKQLIRINVQNVEEEELKAYTITNLINKRYSSIVSMIAINKQFNKQFSIYRILYDLYESI